MPTDLLTIEDLLHETPEAIATEESLKGGSTLTPDLLRILASSQLHFGRPNLPL
jgi:hypothetical protein